MESKELFKILSLYLPYQVKCQLVDEFNSELELVGISAPNLIELHEIGRTVSDQFDISQVKPILKPLSMLTVKDLEILNEQNSISVKTFKHGTYITMNTSMNGFNLLSTLKQTNKLLEWHYDIYNLIGQGLAIDESTLTKD